MKLLALALAAAVPAVAHAGPEVAAAEPADEEDPPPASRPTEAPARPAPPPLAAPPPAPAPTAIDIRRSVAGSSRGLVIDTALTVPQGSADVTLQAVVPFFGLATLSGGITPSTEIWVDAGGVADSDSASLYGAGIKQMLGVGPNFAVAVTGAMRRINESSSERLLQLGAVATVSNDPGSFVLTGGFGLLYPESEERAVRVVTVGLSAGSRTARFLGEYMRFADEFGLWFAGARFGRADFQVDVGGMLVSVDHDEAALPFLAFSARM